MRNAGFAGFLITALLSGWFLSTSDQYFVLTLTLFIVCVNALIYLMVVDAAHFDKAMKVNQSSEELLNRVEDLNRSLMFSSIDTDGIQAKIDAFKTDIEKCLNFPDPSDLVERSEKMLVDRLEGLEAKLKSRGFTIMWNSLPYSDKFDTFSDAEKIAYFDAITSGNWSKLHTLLRQNNKF